LHIAGLLEAAIGFVAGVGEGSWNILSIGGHKADLPYLTYIFALYTTKMSQSSSPNPSISPPSPTQFECVEESGPPRLKPAGAGVSVSGLEELGGAEVEVCCESAGSGNA
jgi:hypothetical protein